MFDITLRIRGQEEKKSNLNSTNNTIAVYVYRGSHVN